MPQRTLSDLCTADTLSALNQTVQSIPFCLSVPPPAVAALPHLEVVVAEWEPQAVESAVPAFPLLVAEIDRLTQEVPPLQVPQVLKPRMAYNRVCQVQVQPMRAVAAVRVGPEMVYKLPVYLPLEKPPAGPCPEAPEQFLRAAEVPE